VTPDAELVARAREGDLRAMDALVERHYGSVFRLCRSILGDPDRVDDAVQESFIRAYRALPKFRGASTFRTWLLSIAGNEARGALRKSKRRREIALEDAGQVTSGDPDVAEQTVVRDEAVRVRLLVERLPEKQRLAVTLRIDEGLSFREIGEIIDSSEGSARVNYHHGIRRLREMVDE
jgi:RNA polymerase sigma-70 factor, ECF subfamily